MGLQPTVVFAFLSIAGRQNPILYLKPLLKSNERKKLSLTTSTSVGPASPVHRARYRTNWDRRGCPGPLPLATSSCTAHAWALLL